MKVLEPDDLLTMCSDDIIIEIVKLYKDGEWNQDKNFKYLVMKKALYHALLRECVKVNDEVRSI